MKFLNKPAARPGTASRWPRCGPAWGEAPARGSRCRRGGSTRGRRCAACVSRSWRDTARRTLADGIADGSYGPGLPNPGELKWEHFAARTPCALAECRTPHWSSEGFKFDCLVGDRRRRSPDGKCCRVIQPAIILSGEDGVPTPRMRRENLEVTDLYMYSKRMLRDYLYGLPDSSDEDTDSSEGEMGTKFWRLPTI